MIVPSSFCFGPKAQKGEHVPLSGKKVPPWAGASRKASGPKKPTTPESNPGGAKTPESRPENPKRPEFRAWGRERDPFLNAERVEGQGGQNQLYEKSTETDIFLKEFIKKTEEKIPPQIFGNWAVFACPSGQGKKTKRVRR